MGNFDDYLLGQSIAFMQKHSQYGMSPLQSIKTMGDENMEQRKFKIGDKIRIANGSYMKSNGKIATIVNIDCSDYKPYHVQVHETKNIIYLNPEEMELVEEEKEMTGFEVLLKHWGIEVGEKFNIKEGMCNPYHFDEHTRLIDCDGDVAGLSEWRLVKGELTIQKIEVKEMTMKEICEALGYEVKIKKEDK